MDAYKVTRVSKYGLNRHIERLDPARSKLIAIVPIDSFGGHGHADIFLVVTLEVSK